MSEVEQFDVDQDEKDKEKEEQFIAVEDAPEGEETDEQEDQEDEEKEETRLGGGRDDEDKGKKSRREDGRTRRARQRKAKERTDREMGFLRTRNEQLERRFSELEANVDARVTGNEISGIDQNISKSRSDLQLANQVIAQAVEQNNGAHLAEAMDHRDNIRDNLRDLEQAKEYLTDEDNRRTTEAPMQLDPRHVAHAQAFMIDNDWWDPRARDTDSKTVLAIDTALVQEGFDPTSKDYWDELRQRVQKDLPQHFDAGGDEDDDDGGKDTDKGNGRQTRRNKGPTFRTGGRERSLKDNEVYISPERRSAMEEAGIWDDPDARNSMLKRYAEYDREAREQAEKG